MAFSPTPVSNAAGRETAVRIDEFVAINVDGLRDEDGDHPDWIEIGNHSDEPINLGGWFITDDPDDLRKWEIPDVTLRATRKLIVFASGKDRVDPGPGGLHTNFKLKGADGFLALVRPDGSTTEHSYGKYPAQYADVSFGLGGYPEIVQIVDSTSEARYLAADSPLPGVEWANPDFDDSEWAKGGSGIGFWTGSLDYSEEAATTIPPDTTHLYARIPLDPVTPDRIKTLLMRYDDGFRAFLNGHQLVAANVSTDGFEALLPHQGDLAEDAETFGVATFQSFLNAPLPEGVVAAWDPSLSSGGSLSDFSGGIHDATLRGPVFETDEQRGRVLRFDGVDDLVVLQPDKDFDSADFSVSAWVYVVEGENYSNRLVSRDKVTGGGRKLFALRTSYRNGERPAFQIFQHEPEMLLTAESDQPLKTGWHQLVGVREAGVKLDLYIDGLLRGTSGDFSTEAIDVEAPLTIGGYLYGDLEGEYFKGVIDEVAVYNRALSPAEVALDYFNGTPAHRQPDSSNILAIEVANHRESPDGLLMAPELTATRVIPHTDESPGFLLPTPGGPNGGSYPGLAPEPILSTTSARFDEPFLLTIEAADENATIRYTVDGSLPDETSPVYSAPLFIDRPTVVSARSYVDRFLPGEVSTVGYLDAPLLINEFLAVNTTANPDNVDLGDYSDWIELYNPSGKTVDLSLFGLTDDREEPFKWRFPSGTTIAPGGYLLVWADGETGSPGQRVQRDYSPYDSVVLERYHAGFQLSGDGETVALFSPGGELVDGIDYPKQMKDVSMGRTESGEEWALFGEPTPGKANKTGSVPPGAKEAGMVTFSIPGGLFEDPQTITLTATSPDSVIRYSLDGSKPDSGSPVYTEPLRIDTSTVVRARAFEPGRLPGRDGVEVYLFDMDSDLPIVSVAAYPGTLYDPTIGIFRNNLKKRAVPTHIDFYDPDGGGEFHVDAGLKLVGFVIQQLDQKPMSIELDDRWGAETLDYPLFEDRPFRAYTEFLLRPGGQDGDKTFLREGLVNTVVRNRMDIDYQAYRPVRLYLNGEYFGLYNIREKQDLDYIHLNHPEVDGGPVDLLEHDVRPAVLLKGTSASYEELVSYLETADMSLRASYNHVASMVDLNEFINHEIVSLYVGRWTPDHNMKFWKADSNGRWRWMVMDVDSEWGAIYSASFKTLEYVTDPNGRRRAPTWASVELRNLLRNSDFRNEFIQRFAAHMAITFEPGRVDGILADLKAAIETEMPHQIMRWPDRIPSLEKWEQNIGVMTAFTHARPGSQRRQLVDYFDLEGTANVSIENATPELGSILVQDVVAPPAFEGGFFLGVPLSIEAVPTIGAKFAGWSDGRDDPLLEFAPEGDVDLRPLFEPDDSASVIPPEIEGMFTLTAADSPWLAPGPVSVPAGSTLLIEAGATVLMPDNASLIVKGRMEISGSADAPVTIAPNPQRGARNPLYRTSDSGDGGDGAHRWGVLAFDHSEGPVILRHLQIRGASSDPASPLYKGAVTAIEADIVMEQLLVEDVLFPLFVEGGTVVLRDSVIHASAVSDGINVKRARSALVEDCEFIGGESFDTDAIDYDGISDGRILNNRVHGFTGFNSDGIDLGEGSSDILIRGNIIYDCNDKGVSVGQGSTVLLSRNIIYNCGQGVGIKDSGSFAMIDRNTFHQNGTAVAVFEKNVGAGGGSATVLNSILSASTTDSVYVDSLSDIEVRFSLSDVSRLNGPDNLFADPLFINPASEDFRLQTGSPAIDAGATETEPDPDGTRADLGAVPYQNGPEAIVLPSLVITEIHYNPSMDQGDDEDFEFLELLNTGSESVDLEGCAFVEGIEFEFPAGAFIGSFERIVVARNAATYADMGLSVFEWSAGALANDGERITLADPEGRPVDSVNYDTGGRWPEEPDGSGPSLAIVDPRLPNDQPGNWRSGVVPGGTPGEANWIRSNGSGASISEGNVRLSWSTIPGVIYQLEFTDSLIDPAWTPVNSPEPASGERTTFTDPEGLLSRQRYYRAKAVLE